MAHAGKPTLTFVNARLVLDDEVVQGALSINDGLISAIEGASASCRTGLVDLDGDYLIAGMIDVHTDNLERHFQPRKGVTWDGVAAAIAHDAQIASAGITTVFDSLTIGAASDWNARADMVEPMINGLFEASGHGMLRIEHKLHLRCEITHPDLIEIYRRHSDQGPIDMVSLMDHAPGDRQSPDIKAYRDRYQDGGMSDAATDAHIEGLIEGSRLYGPKNRESIASAARASRLPLATHDDATAEHIDLALGMSACFTEFPTTLEAARYAKTRNLPILMGSPNLVRGGSHSGNVSARTLADAGCLDLLASDYIPASLIKAAFRLADDPFNWSLPQALQTITSKPARVSGLTDRGRIEPGLRADLVRVRMIHGRPIVRGVWSAGARVA